LTGWCHGAYGDQENSTVMQEYFSLIVFCVAMAIVAAFGFYFAAKERKEGQQRR
jgi:hypothetical protein